MTNWQDKYLSHRSRIIERWREKNGIAGGQGRTPDAIRRDASGVFFAIVLLALVIILLLTA